MGKNVGFIGCPLCGAQLEVKLDRKGKPFTQCNPCGLQLFVRSTQGIGLLDQRMKLHAAGGAIGAGERIPAPIGVQFERIQQLAELAGFRESIDGSKLSKDDKARARAAIDRREKELRDLIDGD